MSDQRANLEAALRVEGFEARLRAALDGLAAATGARAWALVDMASEQGVLEHRLRLCSAGLSLNITPGALSSAMVLAEAAGGALPDGALGWPGGVQVLPLAVSPKLWQGPDAALLWMDAARPVEPEALAALSSALGEQRQLALSAAVRVAVETARDPIELTDAEVRLLHVNAAWERFTGYGRDEVVGRYASLLRDPEAPVHDPAFYRYTEYAIHEVGQWVGFVASRAKDGRRLSQEVSVSQYGQAGDRFCGNFAVRRSLEGRAAREEALALSHLELRALLLAFPVPVAVLREGRVLFCNGSMVELLQRSAEALVGAELRALLHPEDRDEVLVDGRPAELRVLRSDGAVRLVDAISAGRVSFEGAPAAILFMRDRTERRLQREQRAYGDRLSAVVTIASSIGHEVNNPLGVILATATSLFEGEARPAQREALSDLLEATRRVMAVAGELRSLSSLRAETPAVAATVDAAAAVPVDGVLNAALNLSGNQLRHLTRVERDCPEGLLAVISEGDLLQVLMQLLINAADALTGGRPADNRISVRGRLEGDSVVLVVEDNGHGVDLDVLPRAFEPFVTGRAGRQGLGLAIARSIALAHHGALSLENSGAGARATLRLPGRMAAVARPTAALTPARSGRVLVVDDEPSLARAIQRALRGYEVELVHDGADALARLNEEPEPDLILCDLMMPGLTGPAVYEAVGRIRPHLQARFLFLTGGAFTEEGRSFIRRMGPRVLEKPFLPSALRARVATELQGRVPAV